MTDRALTMPPVTRTASGDLRRVGVELELMGMEIDDLSAEVATHTGGEVRAVSRYEHVVEETPDGPWRIELDFRWLRERGRTDSSGDSPLDLLEEAAEHVVRVGAETFVPLEVVSPPLGLDRLDTMVELIDRLRRAGAKGTGANWSYAFGLQLNPELPALDARTIAAYLKAFLCLSDWLVERCSVDWTRRLSHFAAPFPADYVLRVIDRDYWPALPELIDDFLADNPTRNRALDMLPLFAHLDEPRVRRTVADELIKSRPTLHYRLPNCEIDDPSWNLDTIWNDWVKVERLAADEQRLGDACARYAESLDGRSALPWLAEVKAWVLEALAP